MGDWAPRSSVIEAARAAVAEVPAGLVLAMVFGSSARGSATDASDLDVAILGTVEASLDLGVRLEDRTGRPVDVVRLDDPGIPLLEEILRDGIVIFEDRPGRAASWRAHAWTTLELDGPAYRRGRDLRLARLVQATHGHADLVRAKLVELLDKVARIREVCPATADELRSDRTALEVVCFNLMLAVQSCADVASHVIADEGFGVAVTLARAFESLRDHGVITAPTCDVLRRAARFRNVVAHGYGGIDVPSVHLAATAGLADLESFARELASWIDKRP